MERSVALFLGLATAQSLIVTTTLFVKIKASF
jgi:hypothetical protein